MKHRLTIYFSTLLLFFACNDKNTSTSALAIIDIASGIEHLTTLKASDIVTDIQYIPLETNDNCLVSGSPSIQVFNNKIVITSRKDCFLFNKEDGKFICSVGHVGNDPEGYRSAQCWIDEITGIFYFKGWKNELIKYDQNGKFLGKITLPKEPEPTDSPSHFIFSDSLIIGRYSNMTGYDIRSLAFFSQNGQLIDTIPSLISITPMSISDIASISILKGDKAHEQYGNVTQTGIVLVEYKNDKKSLSTPANPVLWKNKKNICFKPDFVDTIYTIEGTKIKPYLTYNTGKYHCPETERHNTSNIKDYIAILLTIENEHNIFFQFVKDLYNQPILYNGLYDKKNKTTKIAAGDQKITDDITNFMPIQPIKSNNNGGEYISIIQASDALSWLEEHPRETTNKQVEALKLLKEDDNPIIVIMK